MEHSYAKSLSKNKKVLGVSTKQPRLNTYKYSLIKLPLIKKDLHPKQKSVSNYSTQLSKRLKQPTKQKRIASPFIKQRKQSSARNFATDRDRSKSKNSPVKQQQLLMSYESNQSQHPRNILMNNRAVYNRSAAKSIEDQSVAQLEWSINTVDTEPIRGKNRMVEFQNIGLSIKLATKDLGHSSSLKTTDILDTFESHVKKYGTQHVKLIPISKTKPNQTQISKQLQKIQHLHRQTEKSIDKYIGYKKYQIEQTLNQRLFEKGENRNKIHHFY